MVRLFLLFTFLIFISCDDGDFKVESFDFSNATTQSCNQETSNFFIYRLSTNEALIIKIPESIFNYDVTPTISPNILDPISVESSGIEVIYRLYNGTVSTGTLCAFLPPISPNVIEEWNATSGTIKIVTNVAKANNTGIGSENATRIIGYNHEIEFQNITFSKPNGTEQFYDNLVFGSFQNPSANTLASFSGLLLQCNSSEQVNIYKSANNQAISLKVPATLFPNEVTPIGNPRQAFFDSDHIFTYQIFLDNLAQTNSFCENEFTLVEEWTAQNGDENSQIGVIEVTTAQSSEGFEHTVVLKKAIMERGNVNFTFGDAFTLGTFILTP